MLEKNRFSNTDCKCSKFPARFHMHDQRSGIKNHDPIIQSSLISQTSHHVAGLLTCYHEWSGLPFSPLRLSLLTPDIFWCRVAVEKLRQQPRWSRRKRTRRSIASGWACLAVTLHCECLVLLVKCKSLAWHQAELLRKIRTSLDTPPCQ